MEDDTLKDNAVQGQVMTKAKAGMPDVACSVLPARAPGPAQHGFMEQLRLISDENTSQIHLWVNTLTSMGGKPAEHWAQTWRTALGISKLSEFPVEVAALELLPHP